jgi:hypothetical protein
MRVLIARTDIEPKNTVCHILYLIQSSYLESIGLSFAIEQIYEDIIFAAQS